MTNYFVSFSKNRKEICVKRCNSVNVKMVEYK